MEKFLPFIFALGTAFCWGLYGPALGKARALGGGTPFKPYVGIGVAYLLIAIVGGLIAMAVVGKDKWDFTDTTSRWGFLAGVLGALGAFSLTLAMFSGGHRIPHAVMPFVFGGAVTVVALFGVLFLGGRGNVWMWIGIIGMGVSAVLVAANTPHGSPKKHDGKQESHAAAEKEDATSTSPAATSADHSS